MTKTCGNCALYTKGANNTVIGECWAPCPLWADIMRARGETRHPVYAIDDATDCECWTPREAEIKP